MIWSFAVEATAVTVEYGLYHSMNRNEQTITCLLLIERDALGPFQDDQFRGLEAVEVGDSWPREAADEEEVSGQARPCGWSLKSKASICFNSSMVSQMDVLSS